MDGGTEWDAARNWLEMADREDLLELLSYLGVDMGSLPQDQLVEELHWTKHACPLMTSRKGLVAKGGEPEPARGKQS